MKLIPVETIPKREVKKNAVFLRDILEGFIHSSDTIVKVDIEGHYTCTEGAVKSIRQCINRYDFPIKIVQRIEDIYLVKV